MDLEARMLATQGDCSLVWMIGRRFPGVLLQADSLKLLTETLDEATEALAAGNLDDAAFAVADARNRLAAWLAGYEEMMAEQQLDLPYRR